MTICVAVKVGEGLVLAADSTTTIQGKIGEGPPGVIKTYDFASKVTQIKDYPIGVFSWGIGSIGPRSIQSIIMEFEHDLKEQRLNPDFRVRQIAQDLFEFIRGKYNTQFGPSVEGRPSLGMFAGGYSDKAFFPEEYWFELPQDTELKIRRPDNADGTPSFGVDWFGQTDAISRLIHGYDRGFITELINRGLDRKVINEVLNSHKFEYPFVFEGMPIQDAIDFAVYLVQLTIGRFRFVAGPPVCGGDVDVALITPGKFQWIHRKQWLIKG